MPEFTVDNVTSAELFDQLFVVKDIFAVPGVVERQGGMAVLTLMVRFADGSATPLHGYAPSGAILLSNEIQARTHEAVFHAATRLWLHGKVTSDSPDPIPQEILEDTATATTDGIVSYFHYVSEWNPSEYGNVTVRRSHPDGGKRDA